jgi:uncharacterized membrane protein required for colicin V production
MAKVALLDIAIVVLIVGGSLNGLRIGAIRQLGSLLIFYVSLVLSTRFYHLLLPSAQRLLVGAPGVILESILFLILLVLIYAILGLLILDVALERKPNRAQNRIDWRHLERANGQSFAGVLNHLAGLALGFVTIGFWIGALLIIYNFLISASWLDWENYRLALEADYQKSVLVPVFQNLLPYLIDTLRPWFPAGLPTIFLVGNS